MKREELQPALIDLAVELIKRAREQFEPAVATAYIGGVGDALAAARELILKDPKGVEP